MADSFQPKFVDLVRNFTTTAGTGNLVLGEAAPGFTSFTSALQPGDSFYYSIVGLEKTTETEVGRGTLQADASIARDAIDGTLTDFSPGRKSVALVAAAEWFDSIEAVRGAPALTTSRTALAGLLPTGTALLDEGGRNGIFIFADRDLSAEVGADSAQGIYVAPASDPSGASGAWVRQYDGALWLNWFGAVEGRNGGANAASNNAAFAGMLSAAGALAVKPAGNLIGLPPMRVGPGAYEISSAVEFKDGTVDFGGAGNGNGTAVTMSGITTFVCHDCTGFLLQSDNTSGTITKDAATHLGASRSYLHDFMLEGTFDGVEAEHHGVHARCTFVGENINARKFAGDGFHIAADTVTLGGNCSNWRLVGCDAQGCRDGLHVFGNNAGAGKNIGGPFRLNRRWGIHDENTIGNWHCATLGPNGINADNDGVSFGAAVVAHNGNQYGAIAGEEAWSSANPPSGTATNNQGWYYIQAGTPVTGIPAWSNGMLARAGGAVHDTSNTARNTYDGCHAELGGGKAQIGQRSLVVGGFLSTWCYQNSSATRGAAIVGSGNDGIVKIEPGLEVLSGSVTARLGSTLGNAQNQIFFGSHPVYSPTGWRLQFAAGGTSPGDLRFSEGNGSTTGWSVTTATTANEFGTGAAVSGAFHAPLLMVGDSIANARLISNGETAPSGGLHSAGEFVFYRGATLNLIGFNCIASGTPGTWQSLYGLAQLEAAGSGLTMTGTDKLLGRSSAGAGTVEEIICTVAGRALLDDADAAEQRATLGLGTAATMAAEWALNFTADGAAYIPAAEAISIGQANVAIGTGTLAFEQSSAAAPDSFAATSLPATLEPGAWLKVSASGVGAFIATHLKRIA